LRRNAEVSQTRAAPWLAVACSRKHGLERPGRSARAGRGAAPAAWRAAVGLRGGASALGSRRRVRAGLDLQCCHASRCAGQLARPRRSGARGSLGGCHDGPQAAHALQRCADAWHPVCRTACARLPGLDAEGSKGWRLHICVDDGTQAPRVSKFSAKAVHGMDAPRHRDSRGCCPGSALRNALSRHTRAPIMSQAAVCRRGCQACLCLWSRSRHGS